MPIGDRKRTDFTVAKTIQHPVPGRGIIALVSVSCGWMAVTAAMLLLAQGDGQRDYVDPARRFRFSYPASFGAPSTGTNDGFEDRVAAVRFATFSSSGIGGEAALTRGFPLIDLEAVGGLYDAIALEIFPAALRRQIVSALVPLTPTNFCGLLAQERHLDPASSALTGLTAQQRAAVASVDHMRHVGPRVVRCVVDGDTVTFDKEAGLQPGGPRQHVYGAVRFLGAPYSTFQIVRAGSAPDDEALNQMTAVVRSWSPL
ncbi:MAG: hypothetical protein HOP16_11720 [Acidobacteria bacterium]|nr:hypothetical protein [Acidobacteriota bacterium]